MEILFCDACDGSISRTEVEEGRVVRVSGRTYHRACAPRAGRSGHSWLPWLLLAPALAAGFALGAVLKGERDSTDGPPGPEPARARLEAVESQLQGLSAQLQAAVGEARRQDLAIGDAIVSRDEAIRAFGEDLDLLAETVARLARVLSEPPPAIPVDAGDGERLRTLLEEVTSTDFGTRFSAIRALALRPESEALRAVRGRLADPDRQVRIYALWQLGERADDGSAGEMVALLGDDDQAVRAAAHRALRLVSGMNFPFDTFAPEATRREQARIWEKWWQDREREREDGD